MEFRLPTLDEGIQTATVTGVLVKPGDTIAAGQGVITIETDKASMDVEADTAGTVEKVHIKPGDKLQAGAVVLTLSGKGAPKSPPAGERTAPPKDTAGSRPATAETPPQSVEPRSKASTPAPPIEPRREPEEAPIETRAQPQAATLTPTGNGAAKKELVPAGPATRRLARELGVSLTELKGSGRGGRVTLDDIKELVRTERRRIKEAGGAGVPAGGSVVNVFTLPPLPDFAKFGEIERKPVSTIRQTIAKNLTIGWRTMPMVTQHDLADITELEAGRKRVVEGLPKGSPKVTMTVLAIKACVAALRDFPHVNSSYDMNAGELVIKKYVHIGIAVDTERGLVVPVIRDADRKGIRDLAAEVGSLAEKARAGKLAIDEMRGGTFTITNLGGIGGTSFTPIVNYPEVAILGLSRSTLQPAVRDGQIVPRLMMPLSLTYDHRVIDGADGARFTTRLVQLFSDPLRLLMEA